MPVQFDEDLEELTSRLLTMGATAEQMIHDMNSTLVDRNADFLDKIRENESQMDKFQNEIDDETVRLISVYTPVAGDLRLLLMVTRINAELERIGDQTFNILKVFESLLKEEPLKPLVDLPRMANLVQEMVHNALDAFVEKSDATAMKVIEADDKVDKLNDQIFRELVTYMLTDPKNIGRALGLVLTARAFERIGDHAVNIAEDVVYVVRGEDIRHEDA
jgi:phosphate transport system protein